MLGFCIALFCVMMAYAAIGYGLGAYFPLFVIHFFPVVIPFIVGAYVKEFFDKDKPQDLAARGLRITVIAWFAWAWVEVCSSLDKFYKTGKLPNEGLPVEPFGETMLHVAVILVATFMGYGVIIYVVERIKRVRRERKREEEKIKEEIAWNRKQEEFFLERIRAFKAEVGSDSYT